MRILFLSNLYPPNTVGGYERLCFEVAAGLVNRGHQVMVLTSNYGGKMMDFPGQVIWRDMNLFAAKDDIYKFFNCTPEQQAAMNAQNDEVFKCAVKQFEPYVIFVWNLFFYDPSLLDAIKQAERPIFYLLTDNWLAAFLNPGFVHNYMSKHVLGHVPRYQVLYDTIRRWLKNSGKTNFFMPGRAIFASCFMRKFYAEAGFQFEGNTIIYHGVTLPVHHETRFAVRKKFIVDGELRLLFAGRIVEIKGVHTVIQSLRLILKMLPDLKVQLTIIGDDQDHIYWERIRNQIETLQLPSLIEFIKPVAEDKLFDLFQQYDIYLFPSLYEPFSLTLIHALHAGIPTIASDAGGNPEIVHHAQTGLLFQKGNDRKLAQAVVRLAKDHILRQRISENARHIAQEYTFDRMLTEIEQYLGNEK